MAEVISHPGAYVEVNSHPTYHVEVNSHPTAHVEEVLMNTVEDDLFQPDLVHVTICPPGGAVGGDHAAIDRPNLLDQLAQRIAQTGGVSFAVTSCISVLAVTVFVNGLAWLVPVLLKCISLQSLLAWYWISVNEDIRLATDAMFRDWMKRCLSCFCWPSRLRSWVETI